jgi:antitoxin VapB
MVYTDTYQETAVDSAHKGTTRAKLFRNGRSQAVRLPREFRFEGDEVSIRRDGDAVILEPVKRDSWPRGYWERLRELRLDFEVEPINPSLEDVDLERS